MGKKRDVAEGIYAPQCIAALRAAFPHPEYAFFEQVANGTGFGAKRWADAVAMGIWPSRGLLVHGFEVKVSRSDFLAELKNPAKAEEIQQFCDRWWIVAPRGMIDPAELPPTWGLYGVNEKGEARVAVQAPELTPRPISKAFVAAVLRRHSETWHNALLKAKHEGKEEGIKSGPTDLETRAERAEKRLRELSEKVEQFEGASGLSIAYGWNLGKVGEAVQLLMHSTNRDSYLEQLERDAAAYEHRLESLRKDIETIKSVKAPGAAA